MFNDVSDSGLENEVSKHKIVSLGTEEAKEFLEKGQNIIYNTIEQIMEDRHLFYEFVFELRKFDDD